MAKTSLGKVSVLPKGEYSSVIQYSRLDIVTYKGSSYLCIKDSLGIEITNEEYWQLLAQKGDTGEIGATGAKGDKGDAGKDFSIYKTYPSISAMESDASNVPEGEFVLIASDVEDTDNAKLYVKSNTGFVYLTDLSGATGIKGEKGDKPINGIDYNTPEEKEEFKNEVVENATVEVEQNIANIQEQAIQEFNSNASTKTNEYNSNTTTKLQEYNTNANTKIEEYNSNATQKTNTFNGNATTQIETFNNNATSKTNDFNSNASSKTDEFNTNYEEKLESINEASTSIEQERVISDGKYARALKRPVTDVESTQIYAENDVVDDLIINGVELTQVVTEQSENIINLENKNSFNMFGINVQIENNTIILNGTATNSGQFQGFSLLTNKPKISGNYSFGNIVKNGSIKGTHRIYLLDSNLNEVLSFTNVMQYTTGNILNETEIKQISIFINSGNVYDNYTINLMLLSGTEFPEEYIPFTPNSPSIDFPSEVQVASEQNITINETNITIPLINSAIGQYADTIDRKNNLQNKVIQELILTGDEQYTIQSTETNTIRFKLLIAVSLFLLDNTNVNYICNFLHSYPYSERTDDKEGIFIGKTTTNVEIYFRVPISQITTVEQFKGFLSEQYQAGTPVKIYYVAQSPTTNPLSEEVQTALSNFKLYQDLNNIAIDNGSMSFIYNKSLLRALEEQSELSANLLERVQVLEQAQVS